MLTYRFVITPLPGSQRIGTPLIHSNPDPSVIAVNKQDTILHQAYDSAHLIGRLTYGMALLRTKQQNQGFTTASCSSSKRK